MRLAVEKLRVELANGADVIDDVSFSLGAGQTLGLVGESGSGKTTAALAVLGHARSGLRISGGRVAIDDVELLSLSKTQLRRQRGRQVAYVPQDPASALNPAMKLGKQMREVLERHEGKTPADVALRIREVLAEVKLPAERVLSSYPHQLSGGQLQRVAVAMAFLARPGVIVLDEPTTGLDVTTQRYVMQTIRELSARHGVAAIFVSHDLAVVSELADSVAVMYAGRLVERGSTDAVLRAPSHPYTQRLIRAVPSPDAAQVLIGLTGHPPRPGHRSGGCLFAPRCPAVITCCTREEPKLVEVNDGRWVRCLRVGEAPSRVVPSAASRTGDVVPGPSVLMARGVHASYGLSRVLHDVEIGVSEGECVAVVGESGSGKTTLARCLAGLHARWDGELTVAGEALRRKARQRTVEQLRAIQYVFQNPYGSLNPRHSVRRILEQPLHRFLDVGVEAKKQRLAEALRDVALADHVIDRFPGELSGGERQRVAIARAIIVQPRVLICDEVTSSLDVSVQAAIIETLCSLQRERGVALIFITHNLALVRSVAQRVVVMQAGRIVESGDSESLLQNPQAAYTQQLLRDLPRLSVPHAARREPSADFTAAE